MNPRRMGWTVDLMFGMFGLLAAFQGGCAQQQIKTLPAPKTYDSPKLEFRGIGSENASFSSMELVFRFELVGKDPQKVRAMVCPFRLMIEGMPEIRGTMPLERDVEGEWKLPVVVSVPIPWPKDPTQVIQFLSRERLGYQFNIECKLNGPEGQFTVRASDAAPFSLPHLPGVDITSASVERFDKENLRLNFELSISNRNTFRVNVNRLTYQLIVENIPVAEGELATAEVIESSNETSYDLATPIFSRKSDLEIIEAISKQEMNYHLKGTLEIEGFRIPIDKTGKVSFAPVNR